MELKLYAGYDRQYGCYTLLIVPYGIETLKKLSRKAER